MPLWDKLFKKKDEGSAGLKPIVQKSPAPVAAQRVSNAKPVAKPAPPPAPAPKAAAPAPEPPKPERESKRRKKSQDTGTHTKSRAADDAALLKRGQRRQAEGDHAGAIEDFTKAIGLNPNCAQAYASRGLSKEANGDGAGAKADYSKSIQIEIMSEINRQMRENPEVEM